MALKIMVSFWQKKSTIYVRSGLLKIKTYDANNVLQSPSLIWFILTLDAKNLTC